MKKMLIICALFITPFLIFAQQAEITYSVHMTNVGWSGFSSNGETAGTTGQSRAIEAIRISVKSSVSGGIRYDVYTQNVGWLGWQYDNDAAGTTGRRLHIEAIRVQLTGELADKFEIRYRVHMANIGWSGWSFNGEASGTTGQNRRVEAIQILLEPSVVSQITDEINKLAIQDVNVRVVEEGISIDIENIQFAAESAVLLPAEQIKLDKIAEVLKRYPERNLIINGHTALAGTAEGRLRLSQERAKAVADYLISKNVRTSNRITSRGYGADKPIADNNTEQGMRRNRRVEIILAN